MRVAFRVDGTPRMGGGHLMRCLTLADALAGRGATATFVSAAAPEAVLERIRQRGHAVRTIAPGGNWPDGEDWDSRPFPANIQRRDAEATARELAGRVDWLVVDHYLLDRAWQAAMRPGAGRILAIDDLANRDLDCDVLVDQTFGRVEVDYAGLVPGGCRRLVGAGYALLRPEFAAARDEALAAREARGPARRLLVSMGTTDVDGITARVTRAVLAAARPDRIDVVLGAESPSLGAIARLRDAHRELCLHVETTRMASLMAAADLAVGAAGTTSWERCCLGLPSLVVVLAANQQVIADKLDEAGAHRLVSLSPVDTLSDQLVDLLHDDQARRAMARIAAGVTDGRGAARVAAAMMEA